MIREVPGHHLPQPLALFLDRVMPSSPQLVSDFPQGAAHAIAPALPQQQESAVASLAAHVGEAEKVEGLRPSLPPPDAALGSKFAELDQAGLLRMEGQRKLRQPVAHRRLKAFGVIHVLEPDGYAMIGALFGLSPEMALALSLAKRGRDLMLGIPALLAWQALELVRGRRFSPRTD